MLGWVFVFILIIVIFIIAQNRFNKSKKNFFSEKISQSDVLYSSKKLVTDCEKYFLDIIEDSFCLEYRIIPQVPLSSIVYKHKKFENEFQNELYRTIDIGIFNKYTFEPLLMIEINDKSHSSSDRFKRDLKVREILNIAHIPLITFYTDMPNKKDYIIDRIRKNL